MSLLMSPDRIPPTPAHKAKGLFGADSSPTTAIVPADPQNDQSLFNALTNLATVATRNASSITSSALVSASKTVGGVLTVAQSVSGNCLSILTPAPGQSVEAILGPVLPRKGTRIVGTLEKTPSINIPSRFRNGNLFVLIHEQGIRIQPPKGDPLLITKEQLLEAQDRQENELVSQASVGGAMVGTVVGGLVFGPIGAIVGYFVAGRQKVEADAFFMEFSFEDATGRASRMVLRVAEQDAELFSSELSHFLSTSDSSSLAPYQTVEQDIGCVLGAQIAGTVEANASHKIPARFLEGNVFVLLHERGLRLQPPKGNPILIRKEQLLEVQRRLERETSSQASAGGAMVGAVVGGLIFGTAGAILGSMAGSGKTVYADAFFMDFSFEDTQGKASRLVLRVSKPDAQKFGNAYADFLGVKKQKKWWPF